MGHGRMRILLGHNYYREKGGEDIAFASEGALLSEHGHLVEEFTDHNDRVRDLTLPELVRDTLWSRSSHRALSGRLRKGRFDVAHFHNTFMLLSPSVYHACHDAGVPVAQTLHNYRLICPKATMSREGRVCERCSGLFFPWPSVHHACYREDRAASLTVAAMLVFHKVLRTWTEKVGVYIALTRFARRKFIEGGLPADRIVVKPNFVHPDPGKGDSFRAGAVCIGRLSPEKGLLTLLRAWEHHPDFPLSLIGDGPSRGELERFVHDRRIRGVKFLGRIPRPEVLARLKRASFLVFPSECYEGLPMTLLESFACGTPVIAAGMGAMEETVEDGRTGLLFRAGDAEDLASRVDWARTSPAGLSAMGGEARRDYLALYTAERNHGLLMDIYERITRSVS